MNKGPIQYGIIACMCSLVTIIIYAIVRLYVLSQRMDSVILLTNVILFTAIACILMYLMKKNQDLEQEHLFGG
jgi:hypothetical protein